MKTITRLAPKVLVLLALAAACSSEPSPAGGAGGAGGGAAGGAGGDTPLEPGSDVTTTLTAGAAAEQQALLQAVAESSAMTADDFVARYAVPFQPLPYDPSAAAHLPLLQASALALDAPELAALAAHGLVISERQRFPSFVYGYETLYQQDLPLYVSADSILHAVHRSYDDILEAVELASLIPELQGLLEGMRENLAAGGAAALGPQARADADLYVAVAYGLLTGVPAAPVAGGDAAAIQALTAAALAEDGFEERELFGVKRRFDFSQFTPRGHYANEDVPELGRYFQSMMWLGRIDFRLIETQDDHSQLFRRRQLEGAYALRELIDADDLARWGRIDAAIRAFVGEADSMTLPQLDGLLADLGAQDAAGLAAVPDQVVAQAIVDGGYGTQRISSHIMVNGLSEGTLPLSSTFLLLGQRYVVDSQVFSNVVYDRVQGGAEYRMMPDPLDVAFAALGNDQAGLLLEGELRSFHYAPDLHAMRLLVDAHGDAFFQDSLYTLWLSALRTLSPGEGIAAPAAAGLPSIAATEPFGRRLLGTQLASWAELRHDTILYAKQSYTGGDSCEFPDGYVEPYPAFFAAIEAYAARGATLTAALDLSAAPHLATALGDYFGRLGTIAATLREMAEHEATGTAFTADQLAFLNQAVAIQQGCGSPMGAEGWYADLFFQSLSGVEYDPTIADVHTQPMLPGGEVVGRVLHVGTGMPRLLVVTVETCEGPKAYVGLASSYFERITEDFDRLDDERWADELLGATPPDVRWLQDLVVR